MRDNLLVLFLVWGVALSGCGSNPFTLGNTTDKESLTSLGKTLFFDPLLSVDQSISCASCHKPEHGFADDRALSVGVTGEPLRRHTPHLFNLAQGSSFFWDGRARSLEEQALMPIQDPNEMGLDLRVLIKRLESHPEYPEAFFRAFSKAGISASKIAIAIAEFERSLVADSTPYDEYLAGNETALSESAKRGMALFFSKQTNCSKCHSGTNFTDGDFHNTGLLTEDLGRAAIDRVGNFKMRPYPFFHTQKAFKTPGLRNVFQTAPYMHNGAFESLEDVVRNYNQGSQDPESYGISLDIKPLGLSDPQVVDLVSFLEALTSPRQWNEALGIFTMEGKQHVSRR